jgi:putative ABC transport system substrate-binding protein
MSQIKKVAVAVLAAVAVLMVFSACGRRNGNDEVITIGVIQIIDHDALNSARQGFIDGLAEAGFVEGQNVQFNLFNAQGDPSNSRLMAQKIAEDDPDLVLAISTPSSQAMANETRTIPILITAVTDPLRAGLIDSFERPGNNVTGTSDLTPIAKQFDLMMRILPNTRTVGIIYNSSEINSQIQTDMAVEIARGLGLAYEVATVTGTVDVGQVTESIVGKVDVIYISTCNTLAASIPQVTRITDAAGVPVITGEAGGVNLGALATEGINYYKLGFQTAVMAVKVLNGEAVPAEMPIQYQNETNVAVNLDSAARLGIVIPEDLLAVAELVRDAQ